MNKKELLNQLLEQIQEEDKDPETIGKLNIPNTMLWMKLKPYEETTIRKAAKLLRHLERNCNASSPKEVKLYIANKNVSNQYKENLTEAYNYAIMALDLHWNKPFYKRKDKKHHAPSEKQIDFMINHLRLEMALKLLMMKDLGTRPIELVWIKPMKDIDLETGTVNLTGAKFTKGRIGKLKPKTLELLKIYLSKRQLTTNDTMFSILRSDYFADDYRHARNKLAEDYNMPELKQICLYDFRRFFGTRKYHLSNGKILVVKEALGHTDPTLRSTAKYIDEEAQFTWLPVKCTTDEEIQQAIKDDCILVGHENGVWYFKKPA